MKVQLIAKLEEDMASTQISTERKHMTRPQTVPLLLFIYSGYAFLTAGMFWLTPGRGTFLTIDTIFQCVTGIVSLVTSLLLLRKKTVRKYLIVFESILIPLQFGLSIPSSLLLIGMVLSIVVLILLKPVFPIMAKRTRRLFLTLHVGFSVAWLGAAVAMLILGLSGLITKDPDLRHYAYAFMHIFDLAFVIPFVFLSLLTSLFNTLGTPWGLTKYWWVLVKLVIALSIVGFAGAKENFWVRGLAEKTEGYLAINPNADLYLVIFFSLGIIGLWIATILSIYTPWGRTPWAQREWEKKRLGPQASEMPKAASSKTPT